jgi:hypothetical protein
VKQLSARRGAYRNEAAIRGMTADGGSGAHLWHMAPYVACQSVPPPPIEQYEAWLIGNPIGKHARSAITASKLRRAVIMKRGGQTLRDIGRAIGMAGPSVGNWLAKLPQELRA